MTEHTDTTSAPASTPTVRRSWLIGGGAALAAALLAGGGVAIGVALTAGDDRGLASVADQRPVADQRVDAAPSADPAPGADTAAGAAPGAATAADLVAVAAAARSVAEGEIASIDLQRDGSWEVQLDTATGDETEVRVGADGTATVTGTDRDDEPADALLDDAEIERIVAAALAEFDGTIVEVAAADDGDRPYDATVRAADGRVFDLELDAAFAVVSTELDEED